jgi:methylenetetrahydrofolate reductase (NADPH)
MDIGLEWMAPSTPEGTATWIAAMVDLAHLPVVRQSVTMRATTQGPYQSVDAFGHLDRSRGHLMAHATVGVLEQDAFAPWLDALRPLGVDSVLCMRGDAAIADHRFASVLEMVAATAATGWAQPWVAAAPDGHPDSQGNARDFDWLLAKIDAGAVGAITQALFDAERFLRWRDRLAQVRPGFRWVAGLVPVRDWARTERFAHRCGVPLPYKLSARLAGLDAYTATEVARRHMADLLEQLARAGCDGVHVFTLNSAAGVESLIEPVGAGTRLAA